MAEFKSREYSEDPLTEKIMRYFYNIAEDSESFLVNHNNVEFDFFISKIKFRCQTKKGLVYRLPNGYIITHEADIVITRNENLTDAYVMNPDHRFVSIEIKHKSSVTDAFKSRSYDMLHLRKEYPLCLGIMMYIRERNLTIETAKQYCYPYQKFFGCKTEELTEEKIKPLFEEIVKYLKEEIIN